MINKLSDMSYFVKKDKNGFTLIEVIVVMAILGVLASIVLVAINPLEQINKSKDSTKISAIAQLGLSMQSYVTTRTSGVYPTDPGGLPTWQASFLVTGGELGEPVTVDSTSSVCAVNMQGNICYTSDGVNAVIWTVLESRHNTELIPCTGGDIPVAAWIASKGRTGVTCVSGASTPPSYSAVLN